MTYKVGANTVISSDRDGTFETVTFRGYRLKVKSAAENYGYVIGGQSPTPTSQNIIQRFPFADATTNATDVGDLTETKPFVAASSSGSHGYSAGGSTPALSSVIERFPFANETTNASDVGDLIIARYGAGGTSSKEYGYVSGGINTIPVSAPYNAKIEASIEKFSFISEVTAGADTGDLLGIGTFRAATQNSEEYGYSSGGNNYSPSPTIIIVELDIIQRFPFASDSNSADVGDLTVARTGSSGQSSTTYGYTSGGGVPSGTNIIDRFPFSSGTVNATDVGDLTSVTVSNSGQSSTTHGYSSGGTNTTPISDNIIQRFPFSSDTTNASDVGTLTAESSGTGGAQY